ncbi:MAG: UvrD-helicase domain-containing protein [Xylophilus ampelinus]
MITKPVVSPSDRHFVGMWSPSPWLRRWRWVINTDWTFQLDTATSDKELTLTIQGRVHRFALLTGERWTVERRWLWSSLNVVVPGRPTLTLRGLSRADASSLERNLAKACQARRRELHIAELVARIDVCAPPIVDWASSATSAIQQQFKSHGWLTTEFVAAWSASKPLADLSAVLGDPDFPACREQLSEAVRKSLAFWQPVFSAIAKAFNDAHLREELVAAQPFLDQVEKSPLTEEQARAVICFDNRIQVIASAGSGKTSTMVAKAGYALHRQLAAPEHILLLAFNKDAAIELQQRIRDRLTPMGFEADRIVARTFHGFGMDVIGRATGKRPMLAPWVESTSRTEEVMMGLVDDLRDRDPAFRMQWDLFRVVLGRDLPAFGEEESNPEDWDRADRATGKVGMTGFRTLRGEIVRSQGERLIADWLFYQGVDYRYEAPYPIDTADPEHRRYCPDFYYPAIDTFHEHWALDAKGQPPKQFSGYLDGVAWKRQLHRTHGTALIETTMAQLWSGEAFELLARELTRRGIVLDPNPDRPVPGRKVLEHAELLRTFRTFLTHAKSNQLDADALYRRLDDSTVTQRTRKNTKTAGDLPGSRFYFRHRIFLQLFEAIRTAWEDELRAAGAIDFEDMLNQAAQHLESGAWQSPFTLVMVDEFQDASWARARMVKALVQAPGRCLFAVGDDWQSINRFAGADLSVMTRFADWFGPSQVLRLERTFRCPQSLCDVSSSFVLKHPDQLRKQVVSHAPEPSQDELPALGVMEAEDDRQIAPAIRRWLQQLHAGLAQQLESTPAHGMRPTSSSASTPGRIATVFVLGRYRSDEQFVPPHQDLKDRLQVRFMTIHGSKGLEADYVIVPRMVAARSGGRSFPSAMADDPVLQLAMPEAERFAFAEERRIFYVALTRARRSVLLVTLARRMSPFVVELIQEHQLKVQSADALLAIDGEPSGDRPAGDQSSKTMVCVKCKQGVMVPRKGPHGPFLSCNRYPACRSTAEA